MTMEKNVPNVVMDDNYNMFVKALARRYAERGASVYTSAEAIEQDRKQVRTRAIAPDAYSLSKHAHTADMYKSGEDGEHKYMTTDDYLSYFGKCHDTFEAVNYYNLHKEDKAPVAEATVVVNKKRIDALRAAGNRRRVKARPAPAPAPKVRFGDKLAEFFASMGTARRRAMAGMSAMAVAMMLFAGGLFIFSPEAPEANNARAIEQNLSDEELAMVSDSEDPIIKE